MTKTPTDNGDIDYGSTTSMLNTLLTLNMNSVEGYTTAIDALDDNQALANLLQEFSSMHAEFGSALIDVIEDRGETPDRNIVVDVTSDIHQAWLNLKTNITGNDTSAILGEVETGEQAIVNVYENVLERGEWSQEDHRMISSQLHQINQMLNRVRSIETALVS